MDKQWIIMLAGFGGILICIGLYAIYYKMRIKNDWTFGKSKLDMYMMELAKKMQKNRDLYFILENQIDYYFMKNLHKHVSSIMVTNKKIFLFKNFALIKPDDQTVLVEETKFLAKLSRRLNLEPANFEFIKCYQGELYLAGEKISMKNYSDLINQLNQYLLTGEEIEQRINILKLKKLKLQKS